MFSHDNQFSSTDGMADQAIGARKGRKAILGWVILSASAIALSACSGDRYTATADNASSTYATKASDTVGAAFAEGTTLKSRKQTSASLQRDWSTGKNTIGNTTEVGLKKNSSGGFDVTIGGKTLSFSAADKSTDGYGYEKSTSSSYTSLWSWSRDTVDEAASSTHYSEVWQVIEDQDYNDDLEQRAFFVTGTETMPEALRDLPVANYQGWAVLRLYLGNQSNFNVNTSIKGDLALVADFGKGTVKGTIGDLETRQGSSGNPWQPLANHSITLNETEIQGNGYSGTITPVGSGFTNQGAVVEAGYSGAFYGPAAEETAGVLWALIKLPNGTVDSVGYGAFQGEKLLPE